MDLEKFEFATYDPTEMLLWRHTLDLMEVKYEFVRTEWLYYIYFYMEVRKLPQCFRRCYGIE